MLSASSRAGTELCPGSAQSCGVSPGLALTVLQGPPDVSSALTDCVEVSIQRGYEKQSFWDSHSAIFETLRAEMEASGHGWTGDEPGAVPPNSTVPPCRTCAIQQHCAVWLPRSSKGAGCREADRGPPCSLAGNRKTFCAEHSTPIRSTIRNSTGYLLGAAQRCCVL